MALLFRYELCSLEEGNDRTDVLNGCDLIKLENSHRIKISVILSFNQGVESCGSESNVMT